jgi:enoyl-CoA hydratase/carnithine racemase
MTFQVSTRDGILYLTLDTPNSPVNIFTHEAARQVLELMSEAERNKMRAVVFGSAKPGSFINGTRLLFAQAANTPGEVVKSSEILRNAFLAVRRTPVPTIAVIRGNCWGCGVEFLLNIRCRIAADTHDTHFYMTELNDYLLLPIFGAPYNLPHTIGLKKTVEFLLRGQRWSAKTAARDNLINEVAARSTDVPDFIERTTAGKVESCMERRRDFTWGKNEEEIVSKTRAWIYRLPPAYHQVYTDCLDLVEQAAKQKTIPEDIKRHSLLMSAENICTELTRSAFSFFYIRQTASILERDPNPPAGYRLSFSEPEQGIASLFKGRLLEGVTIDDRGGDTTADENIAAVSFIPYRDKGVNPGAGPGNRTPGTQRKKNTVMVELTLNPEPPGSPGMILYNPFPFTQSYFFEAALEKNSREQNRQALSYLRKSGYQVAVTSLGAGKTFGLNYLCAAYLYPLAAYILSGGKAETVNFTMREFGYVRRPHDLIAQLDKNTLARMLRPYIPGTPGQGEIIEALGRLEEPGFRSV